MSTRILRSSARVEAHDLGTSSFTAVLDEHELFVVPGAAAPAVIAGDFRVDLFDEPDETFVLTERL